MTDDNNDEIPTTTPGDQLLRISALSEILLYVMAYNYPKQLREACNVVIKNYLEEGVKMPHLVASGKINDLAATLTRLRHHVYSVADQAHPSAQTSDSQKPN